MFWWIWKLALDLFYGKVQIINGNPLNGKKWTIVQNFFYWKAWIIKSKLLLWKNDRPKPILCKNAISLPKTNPLKSVDDQPILYLRKYTDKQLQHILWKWLTINLNPFENAKKSAKNHYAGKTGKIIQTQGCCCSLCSQQHSCGSVTGANRWRFMSLCCLYDIHNVRHVSLDILWQ